MINEEFNNIEFKLGSSDLNMFIYQKEPYILPNTYKIQTKSHWRIFLMYINFNKIL